jgi:hypothetical protein
VFQLRSNHRTTFGGKSTPHLIVDPDFVRFHGKSSCSNCLAQRKINDTLGWQSTKLKVMENYWGVQGDGPYKKRSHCNGGG